MKGMCKINRVSYCPYLCLANRGHDGRGSISRYPIDAEGERGALVVLGQLQQFWDCVRHVDRPDFATEHGQRVWRDGGYVIGLDSKQQFFRAIESAAKALVVGDPAYG